MAKDGYGVTTIP